MSSFRSEILSVEETSTLAQPKSVVSPDATDAERPFSPHLKTFFARINRSSPEDEYLACRMRNVPSAGRELFAEDDDY